MIETVGENYRKMIDDCRVLTCEALDKWEQSRNPVDLANFLKWQDRLRAHEAEAAKCGY